MQLWLGDAAGEVQLNSICLSLWISKASSNPEGKGYRITVKMGSYWHTDLKMLKLYMNHSFVVKMYQVKIYI
jgi:hypothetical protein